MSQPTDASAHDALLAELDHARKVAGENASNVVTLMLERDSLLAETRGLRSTLNVELDHKAAVEERERQLREALESLIFTVHSYGSPYFKSALKSACAALALPQKDRP